MASKRYKPVAAGAAPYGVQVYPAGVCVVDGCYVVQVGEGAAQGEVCGWAGM